MIKGITATCNSKWGKSDNRLGRGGDKGVGSWFWISKGRTGSRLIRKTHEFNRSDIDRLAEGKREAAEENTKVIKYHAEQHRVWERKSLASFGRGSDSFRMRVSIVSLKINHRFNLQPRQGHT